MYPLILCIFLFELGTLIHWRTYLKNNWAEIKYVLLSKIIVGLLILSIVIMVILSFTNWRPIHLPVCDGTADEINETLKTLACSYIAAWIFMVVNDRLPYLKKSELEVAYAKRSIREIVSTIDSIVKRSVFFRFDRSPVKPTLPNFVDYYVDLINTNLNNPLYGQLCSVREKAIMILRRYGKHLNYNELLKLSFISHMLDIPKDYSNHLTSLQGEVRVDEAWAKLDAIKIYKVYQMLNTKRYKVPYYKIEEDLINELSS